MKSFSVRVLAVIAVLSLIANVLAYYRFSSSRSLVTVGSEVITRKQYQDQLDYQAGRQVLNKLVFTSLVTQAATRDGIMPGDQDVESRIQDIQRRAPQLLVPYTQDAVQMAEFRQDLKTAIALENLRIKDVAVTPADIAVLYNREKQKGDKGLFVLPEQDKTTIVVTENAVDMATVTDLLHQHTPLDVIGRQPRLRVVGLNGYRPNLDASLTPALTKQISDFAQRAKQGDVKTFRQGSYFLTFQVTKSSRAVIPPLSQIQDQVERAARLAQAPPEQAELAELYQSSPPKFHYDTDKYAAYFDAFQNYSGAQGGSKKTASVP